MLSMNPSSRHSYLWIFLLGLVLLDSVHSHYQLNRYGLFAYLEQIIVVESLVYWSGSNNYEIHSPTLLDLVKSLDRWFRFTHLAAWFCHITLCSFLIPFELFARSKIGQNDPTFVWFCNTFLCFLIN